MEEHRQSIVWFTFGALLVGVGVGLLWIGEKTTPEKGHLWTNPWSILGLVFFAVAIATVVIGGKILLRSWRMTRRARPKVQRVEYAEVRAATNESENPPQPSHRYVSNAQGVESVLLVFPENRLGMRCRVTASPGNTGLYVQRLQSGFELEHGEGIAVEFPSGFKDAATAPSDEYTAIWEQGPAFAEIGSDDDRRFFKVATHEFLYVRPSVPYPRRRGWLATCEPASEGLRLSVTYRQPPGTIGGFGGKWWSVYCCTVTGPDGTRFEDTESSSDFLPNLEPRNGESLIWPEQFSPDPPENAGVYRVEWTVEGEGGVAVDLASTEFQITEDREYRC